MNVTTAGKLIELNAQFYQTFAVPFAATRQRIQPGVRRIVENFLPEGNLLDLGCGNGELARLLARRSWGYRYVGVDFSPGLLAAGQDAPLPANFTFVSADLTTPDWAASLKDAPPAAALAFAVLHHIPGEAARKRLIFQVRGLLPPGGRFIHSNWQFLNSRLAARLQAWETAGLSAVDVDPGDYLLDWRAGGVGLRYVHHFSEAELSTLAAATGFQVEDSFYSDGEGGRLGLYQVWQAA
jgi:SAM-dependent methyltransferase